MREIKIVVISFLIVAIVFLIYGFFHAFDPIEEGATINQKIGGILICKSIYEPSIHSSRNFISYRYKTGNQTIDFGDGIYFGREWKKDEQLVKFKKWIILKTGGSLSNDKIICFDLVANKKVEY